MAGYDGDAFRGAYEKVLAKWPADREALSIPTPHGAARVNACGPRDAPPLLLLPGGDGSTSVSWYAQAGRLAATHRVYAADLPCAPGFSTPDPGRHLKTLADLNGWLDALFDGLGLTSAHLGGHSYGAWIALQYTLRAPDRVRSLFLLDPTQCFTGYRTSYLLHALPMLLRPTPNRVRAFLTWESQGATLDPDWLRLQEAAAGFPTGKPVTGPRPTPAALHSLQLPVLVATAGQSKPHDPAKVTSGAKTLLPHATTTTLPNLSHHVPPPAAPPTLTDRLVDFLGDGG